jgi:hypothetical protein
MSKDLPNSKEEKKIIEALMIAAGEDPGLPHWLFVHELRALLDQLDGSYTVNVNTVGNLAVRKPSPAENIHEADELIAAISFLWGKIEWFNEEEE